MRKPAGKDIGYRDWAKKRIVELISAGNSLRAACREENMPDPSTVLAWTKKDPEFAQQYARARELLLEHWAEQIIEIADDSSGDVEIGPDGKARLNGEFANRSRLRVDSRKWLLSKLMPKVYGDKVSQDVKVEGALEVSWAKSAE